MLTGPKVEGNVGREISRNIRGKEKKKTESKKRRGR